MIGEIALKELKEGDIIQLQRKGYYRCDKPYEAARYKINQSDVSSCIKQIFNSIYTCKEQPCVLIFIPDGHSKEMPQSGVKTDKKNVDSKKVSSSKVKKQQAPGFKILLPE